MCTYVKDLNVEHHHYCECSRKNFKISVSVSSRVRCENSGLWVTHLPTPVWAHDLGNYFYHRNCVHNHIDALMRRVALCVPHPTPRRVTQISNLCRKFGRIAGKIEPISRDNVIALYGGFRRRRYQAAKDRLEICGEYLDPRLKMFVKQEGTSFDAKVNPACRAIQYREATFSLQYAQFIKPIEHRVLNATGGVFPKTRFITKGLSPQERAKLLVDKFESLPGCWIMELDASRFDAHVTPDLLRSVHKCYFAMNGDPKLKQMCAAQLKNRGRVSGKDFKITYSLNGGRMSGDMDTALGNCIIMCCLYVLYMQHFNFRGDFVDDGDDGLLFGRGPMPRLEETEKFFQECGFKIKIANVVTDVYKAEFCQSKVVSIAGVPTMVRNPWKILCKTTVNMKFSESFRWVILKTVAMGELSLNRGVPILEPYFQKLIDLALHNMSDKDRKTDRFANADVFTYRQQNDISGNWKKRVYTPVRYSSRLSLAYSWDIGIQEQYSIENRIHDFPIKIFNEISTGTAPDQHRWLFDPFIRESL